MKRESRNVSGTVREIVCADFFCPVGTALEWK